MRKFLWILAAVLLAISAFSAWLWMGGIAVAVTGGGRYNNDIDLLITASKALLILSLICAALAFCWPKVSQR